MKNTATMMAIVITGGSVMAADLKVGDAAPDFKLEGSDGKTYSLSDFKGKKVMLLTWASW